MASRPHTKIKGTPPILEKTIKNHKRCITGKQCHKTTQNRKPGETSRAVIEVGKEMESDGEREDGYGEEREKRLTMYAMVEWRMILAT